jgi:integrase
MGRIAVGQDMAQFSCKLEANPGLWDIRAGRLSGKSHHARAVNREIDKINVAINARYSEIVTVRGQASAGEVKNAFQGIASSQETILKTFREHNDEYEKRAGVTCVRKTWRNYEYSRKNLEKFIRQKYHVSDLPFRGLCFSFIESYEYFLRIDCKMATGSVLNEMKRLRKMIRIAIGKGAISRDPFFGYSPERPKAQQRYVPADEMEKLMKTPLKSPALEVTRDMFVFSCFTGLSYIDLYHLTVRQIVKADDGAPWLDVCRQKTGSNSKIPLLDAPLQLIEKYRGKAPGERVFPMKDNSRMNAELKKIAKLCGIERHLTFHMSRHTFATETCISQGVPIETVSRMMGHKKLSTTQIYAKVPHGKVNEDMKLLSKKISNKYVFVL